MASVTPHPALERMLSRLPGVQAAVKVEAEAIAGRARTLLAEHRVTGDSNIEVSRHRPDYLVSLVDEAAMSIEYGRAGYQRGPWFIDPAEGLHILHRAAEL